MRSNQRRSSASMDRDDRGRREQGRNQYSGGREDRYEDDDENYDREDWDEDEDDDQNNYRPYSRYQDEDEEEDDNDYNEDFEDDEDEYQNGRRQYSRYEDDDDRRSGRRVQGNYNWEAANRDYDRESDYNRSGNNRSRSGGEHSVPHALALHVQNPGTPAGNTATAKVASPAIIAATMGIPAVPVAAVMAVVVQVDSTVTVRVVYKQQPWQ